MTSASIPSIPLADRVRLAPEARRTRAIRLGLAVALLAVTVVAVLLARGPHVSSTPLIPAGSNAIVVLDVSGSVELSKIQAAYSALTSIARSKAAIGLVVFSNYAYEALPPGSPAGDLLPVAALFQPRRATSGPLRGQVTLPRNPWQPAFSSGTEISSGLELARSIVVSHHLAHPTVVLISDLLDDSNDLPQAALVGQAYRDLGIPLRIVGLDPTMGDQQYFLRFAGPLTTLATPRPQRQGHIQLRAGFPTAFAAVAIVIVLLLATNELMCRSLHWRSLAGTEA